MRENETSKIKSIKSFFLSFLLTLSYLYLLSRSLNLIAENFDSRKTLIQGILLLIGQMMVLRFEILKIQQLGMRNFILKNRLAEATLHPIIRMLFWRDFAKRALSVRSRSSSRAGLHWMLHRMKRCILPRMTGIGCALSCTHPKIPVQP